MAKITDYNEIAQVAGEIIDDYCPDLVEKIGREQAIFCVMAIYTTNDVTKGYGQDFLPLSALNSDSAQDKISVIAFANGISVIQGFRSSRYQDRFPLCGYEDLTEDLISIVNSIQCAFDRINSRP